MIGVSARSFSPGLLRFLRELAEDNRREWFAANKERYEREVRGPALMFVGAMSEILEGLAPHVVADPRSNGGSLMRQHRDVRFSKDKSPYKRHVGIAFRHEAGKINAAPGFYLHIEPGACFFAVGMWRPDRVPLAAIRTAIAARPGAWRGVLEGDAFRKSFALDGESLKRAPKGFDPTHEQIDDLRRKDFVGTAALTHAQVQGPGFLECIESHVRAALPLNRFLADAIGVPFGG